jgi:hypothetical protein
LPHAASHIVATLGRLNLIDSLQVAWINAHEARALVTAPTVPPRRRHLPPVAADAVQVDRQDEERPASGRRCALERAVGHH